MNAPKLLLILFSGFVLNAQVSSTGFEGYADETAFTQSLWTSEGFTVPWVNGFDVNRAYVDHAYAQSGTGSLRIFYPAGGYGPVTTGSGAQAPLMLPAASQYYMSYWVRFSDDFSWGTSSEGGKLPGLAGGSRCSGCATCTGSNGFTARLMWRTNGKLVLYLYHLDKTNPPCGDNITLKPGGSDFYITKGQWFKVTQRVKVNTGTNHDGEVELWINEQPALLKTGIQFVSNGDQVNSFYFSTFHGGSDGTWAPTIDSYAWFDDIKISTKASDIFTTLGLQKEDTDFSTQQTKSFQLFPSPVKSGELLTLKDEEWQTNEVDVVWYDVLGNELHRENHVSPGVLQTPTLQTGLYVVKITGKQTNYTGRIVVE